MYYENREQMSNGRSMSNLNNHFTVNDSSHQKLCETMKNANNGKSYLQNKLHRIEPNTMQFKCPERYSLS